MGVLGAILIALPATITAVATLITAIRTKNTLVSHNQAMSDKVDSVKEAVNGRMTELVESSKAQGRIDEQAAQKERETHAANT
jgi:hypothetical protein